jgi:thioredoxin reductase (NADPH)
MRKKIISLSLVLAMTFCHTLTAGEKSDSSDPRILSVTTKSPDEKKIYPIAIIGAGAAGTMAAQRAVLNNNEVLLFTGAVQEQRRSRGNWVRKVDNIPGLARYKRTVLELRNETLQELVQGKLGKNLYIIQDSVTSLEKGSDFFKLTDGTGRTFLAKYVVLATGIMDEQPHIQGSIRPILKYANGQTVAYCCLCDGHRCFGKKTAVIGHSKTAAKTALLLAEKYNPTQMTLLTNGKTHRFTQELLKQLGDKKISIQEAPIKEVLGNKDQKQLTGFLLEDGKTVETEMGYVALGVRPNNQLALTIGAEVDGSGLVLADSKGETSIPNLFVAGDLRANSMHQIYTAWQQAVDVVLLINQRIME